MTSRPTPPKKATQKRGLSLYAFGKNFSIILMVLALAIMVGAISEAAQTILVFWRTRGLSFDLNAVDIWMVYQFLIALFLAIVLMLSIARLRKQWFGSNAAFFDDKSNKKRRVLILAMSPEKNLLPAKSGKTTNKILEEFEKLTLAEAGLSIAEMRQKGLLPEILPDGNAGFRSTPKHDALITKWIQNLRAIRVHIDVNSPSNSILEHVIVIPPTLKGSTDQHPQTPAFVAALKQKLTGLGAGGDDIAISVFPDDDYGGCDYKSFDSVRGCLMGARKWIKTVKSPQTDKFYKDDDICIDTSSGFASFSMGAAIVTLNHGMIYSYMTSYDPDDPQAGGKPQLYDATIDLAAFITDA